MFFISLDKFITNFPDDIEQLKSEFSAQTNVYVIDGITPNALKQISITMDNLTIEDLHIYVLTKPGAIIFNSMDVTKDNVDELSEELKTLNRYVTNQVVIHSDVVFSGANGTFLKQRLEEITGLEFTTQN